MTTDSWRPSWAWAIRKPPPLPEDVQTIRSAAGLFQCESDYSKAETLFLEALALAEELVGREDEALVPLLEEIAGLYGSRTGTTRRGSPWIGL